MAAIVRSVRLLIECLELNAKSNLDGCPWLNLSLVGCRQRRRRYLVQRLVEFPHPVFVLQ
jgi:hypothetical protein